MVTKSNGWSWSHVATCALQVRPAEPAAQGASEADCLELMEMILGALGRDAVGLGSRWAGRAACKHA